MREIKFRAWYPRDNCYVTHGGFIYSVFANVAFQEDGYRYEQYTGLKDKNGVEIYEGDLVRLTTKVTLDSIGTGSIFEDEVAFNNGRFYIKGDASYFAIGDRFESDIEVIGNVHEQEESEK